MLGIQIGNEYLDLPPGTKLELVEENPFLQFAEQEVIGNYSLPFDINNVNPNVKETDYAAIIQKIVGNTGIEARIMANGNQHSIGKLKIEKVQHNLNNTAAGTTSCYYKYGSSSFYEDIKKKRLRDINVGGDRSFDWDDYAQSGPGFWSHINNVMRGAAGYGTSGYDYAFFPVINKSWPGVLLDPDVINYAGWSGTRPEMGSDQTPYNGRNPNRIIPFPYLKYVMLKAVEYAGWKIEGAILDDTDFKKIVLINFRSIPWCYVKKSSGSHQLVPNDPVTFNLQDHLPDVEIGFFLSALRRRFGWWYDFDFRNKKITIRKLADTALGEVKDMTKYASPLVTKKIAQEKKIYALRNRFATDLGDGAPDFKLVTLDGAVDEITDLPAAAEALNAHAYLIVAENNYYVCQQNEDTEAYEWVFLAYNIYDYEPDGATEEVTTEATTVGVEKYNDYLDLIPRIDNPGEFPALAEPGNWDSQEAITLCFFHGLRDNKDGDAYPYGSSHIYDSTGAQVAEWALTFECKKFDGSDVGLYELNWKALLDILNSPEEFEVTLNLPLVEAMKLVLSNRIVIAGVMMFVKQKKSLLEYKASDGLQLEAVRILPQS